MKKLIALALSMMICLSLTVEAFAFEDVPKDAWYSDELEYLVDLGVVSGDDAGRFRPEESVTRAQFATMLSRLFGGVAEFTDVGDGYAPYISWVVSKGYMRGVSDTEFAPDEVVTVEEMACVLDKFIKDSGVELVEYEPTLKCADFDKVSQAYKSCVENCLWYGLLRTDSKDRVRPRGVVTRAECVYSLAKLSQALIPVRVVWDYAGLMSETYELIEKHDIDDLDAVHNNLRYMFQSGEHLLKLKVETAEGKVTGTDYGDVYWQQLQCYPEFGWKFVRGFNNTIEFSGLPYNYEELAEYQADALEAAIEIRNRLYATAQITESMSQLEKARVYYYWIVDNCDYDWDSFYGIKRDVPFAWMSYGVVNLGLATCQGYTAAFNLFMRLEGIECSTVSTPDHIWSTAILDGELYHIDTTWSDWCFVEPADWFAMTPEYSMSRYEED